MNTSTSSILTHLQDCVYGQVPSLKRIPLKNNENQTEQCNFSAVIRAAFVCLSMYRHITGIRANKLFSQRDHFICLHKDYEYYYIFCHVKSSASLHLVHENEQYSSVMRECASKHEPSNQPILLNAQQKNVVYHFHAERRSRCSCVHQTSPTVTAH